LPQNKSYLVVTGQNSNHYTILKINIIPLYLPQKNHISWLKK
jgi:hypothetical protein